jgi:hypothetical protein
MGSTADEVAATLRQASITGIPADAHDCPGARYVRGMASPSVPAADSVAVTMTAEDTVIGVIENGGAVYWEVVSPTTEAIEEFLDELDGGRYPDLAAAHETGSAS